MEEFQSTIKSNMNKITTYIGAVQRPLTLALIYILINPHALDAFLSVTGQQYMMKVMAVAIGFVGFLKDAKMADAKTVTDLIKAIPPTLSPISPLADMQKQVSK